MIAPCRGLAVAAVMIVAACSSEPQAGNDAAFERADGNASASSVASPAAVSVEIADPITRAEPPSGNDIAPNAAEASVNLDAGSTESGGKDAAAAVDAARSYFAAIDSGDYRAAWNMWDRDGAASGMTAPAFAASYAKFADYRADIGPPGRIDSGAGQRYVTIPVTVAATLRDGDRAFLKGDVVLHRTAAIDGASSAQQRWRIYQSNLHPRPA